MTLRTSLFFLTAGLGLSAFGCKNTPAVDSADIATHGMSMDVEATSDDKHTELRVRLWVGDSPSGSTSSGTLVTLGSDDSLALTQPSARTLGPIDTEGQGKIYGALDLPMLDGAVIAIDLKRAKTASALNNIVTMPKAFTLVDHNLQTFKRSETMTLTWDAAVGSHTMMVDFKGDCIQHFNQTLIGDPGTFVLNAGDIKPLSSSDAMKSCSVNLVVTRSLTGINASTEFGHVSAGHTNQIRGYTITSAP